MSSVLLHGVVPEATPRPAQAPAHGRHPAGGLLALTSPAPEALFHDADGSATIAAALDHDRLLSVYARLGPVMPVRFGALFSGPAAVRDRVAADATALALALARLGRAREYGVSVIREVERDARGPSTSPAAGGRDFLRARAAARRARRSEAETVATFLADVEARLGRRAAEIRQTGRTGRGRVAHLAALVPPENEAEFLHLAGTLAPEAAQHGLALHLDGPSPAYSFCPEASHE